MAKRPGRMSADAVGKALDAAASLYAAGRVGEAGRRYGAIEAAAPHDSRAIYALAMIDLREGRWREAVVRLKRVAKLEPNLFPALLNLGRASEALGQWDEAADAHGRAFAIRPEASDNRFHLAVTLAASGRIDEAVTHYRALTTDPGIGVQAMTRLALLRPEAVSEAELAEIERVADDARVAADARIGLRFAQGEALEARGAYDAAFAAFAAGNAARRAVLVAAGGVNDPRRVAKVTAGAIARVEALFTPAFIAAHDGGGDRAAAPIFVVGMPRSGSTLIEQILASHPAVQGMGEPGEAAALFRNRSAYAPGRAERAGFFGELAAAYLAAMSAHGWTRRARLVDKTLQNYLHVGMIALMFPRAVILHSVRDPLDTCLSCYRQLFTVGNETLFDLAEIGEAYRAYRGLMDHWAQVMPGRVIDVDYEALLAEPEAQIRWLVTEACGLAWDPRCLHFHETERSVMTASAAQVRRPLFSTSLQRWRRYERHLGPLIEALRP